MTIKGGELHAGLQHMGKYAFETVARSRISMTFWSGAVDRICKDFDWMVCPPQYVPAPNSQTSIDPESMDIKDIH